MTMLRTFQKTTLLCLILLCTACTKDHDDAFANLSVDPEGYNGVIVGIYQAEWVINRQVVDKTNFTINPNGFTVDHMPNEYLLSHLLDNADKDGKDGKGDIEQVDIKDMIAPSWQLEYSGYSAMTNYATSPNTVDQWTYYDVWVGDTPYRVSFEAAFYATYKQEDDTWTITWNIKQISTQNSFSSTLNPIVRQFDPALPLTLVTTKRIQ